MKKRLFFQIIIMMAIITLPQLLFAQINEGKTNITVFVSSMQSLTVNPDTSASPHSISDNIGSNNNVQIGRINQVNVFSLGKFVLKVSARDDFHDIDGPEIPASSVYVSSGATAHSSYSPSDYRFEKDVNLTINKPKDLIHAQTSGALNNSFEVEYYASGLGYQEVQNGNLDGTVVYTIEVE
jgi:hypothetical protein